MGKLVLHIVFNVSLISAWAQQNLVPNSSFEEYHWCPYQTGSADSFYINACKNWIMPTLGTSDYFNACSVQYDVTLQRFLFSVPENYIGNQTAHSGDAYSFLIFAQNEVGSQTYAEYIQVKLNQILQAGKFYRIHFFVNNPLPMSCSNSIGALFTPNQLNLNTDEILTLDPQFLSDPNVFFCDTNSWYEVQGIFMAQGNEEYMTIGVFEELPQLKVKDQQGNNIPEFVDAAFYIDDVTLTEIEFEAANIFTPNGDGINDGYYLNLTSIGAKKAEIYNRWGNIIIEGEDSLNWDGTFNGKDCSEGVYFIRLEFENNIVSGFIHLIR